MTAYLVMQITVGDAARWAEYRTAAVPLIAEFGGRHVSGSGGVERLEGEDDVRRIALFEFPSVEAIRAFWNSPEYVPVKELRRGAAILDAWAVSGD